MSVTRILFFTFLLLPVCVNAQQPKLMLPVGHTLPLTGVQFSPDGKYLVTASIDKTAKVWNTTSGHLMADLRGHSGDVNSAEFSTDGKYVLTASGDSTVKVWEWETGKIITDFKGHTHRAVSAHFSKDGNNIISAQEWGKTILWKTQTSEIFFEFNEDYLIKSFNEDFSASYSPDEKYILVPSPLSLWDAATGKKLFALEGHNGYVRKANFSNDGKYIITASADSTSKIWETQTGKLVVDLRGHAGEVTDARFSPDGKKVITTSTGEAVQISIWEVQAGSLLKTLKEFDQKDAIVRFSPDGSLFAVGSSYEVTPKILLYNTKTFETTGEMKCWGSHYLQFSPDGNYLVMAGTRNYLWDVKTFQLVKEYKGYSVNGYSNSSDFSRDGKLLATSVDRKGIKIWEWPSGKLLATLDCLVSQLKFSPDGNKILVYVHDGAEVWDWEKNKKLLELKGFGEGTIKTVRYSTDGKFIVAPGDNNVVKIWDAATGKQVKSFDVKYEASFADFTPDGLNIAYVVQQEKQDYLTVRNWKTGKTLLGVILPEKIYDALSISPDGRHIAYSTAFQNNDTSAIVISSKTGKIVFALTGRYAVDFIRFSTDGNYLLIDQYNAAEVWDWKSGKMITSLQGHTLPVLDGIFSPDGRYTVTTSMDNTIRIWETASGKKLMSLINIDFNNWDYIIPDDYIFVDTEGHYDGTEAARNLLYFTCGAEIIELSQAKDQLWVPNLAERIMKGESINAKTLAELNLCGLTPETENIGRSTDEYHFKITPRRGGLGETVLYVNGIEANRYKPEQLKKTETGYELLLKKEELNSYFITGQENQVTIKAYTADNAISSRGAVVTSREEQKSPVLPNLYAVMIGVSDYKGIELDLKYAAKDAADISNAAGHAARKLLNTDGKEHVFIYNLTTAKERYQLPEKNAIKKIMEEIGKKATANDVLLIFFAGHGVMAGEGDKKQFYFLTADASTLASTSAVKEVGISTAELTEWMKPQNIKAQKRILIFDACNSGQAIKDFVKMGGNDQQYMAARSDDKSQLIKAIDKLNEKSGLFILSASASDQSAYEMGRYSQGLLTYALLKAIKQQPDILEDGKYLNISRWFNAAEKTVSELSNETGARQEPQIVSTTNFNIGLVDEEVMAKIVLPQEKPLFAASNFQNSDEAIADDDMELSKMINLQLSDMATRGTESKIVYVTATNSPDAWSLSGRYSVKENSITVQVNLKQSKSVKNRFEISGTTDKLKELVAAITDKAAGMVK